MVPALRNGPQSRSQRSFLERWEHVLMTHSRLSRCSPVAPMTSRKPPFGVAAAEFHNRRCAARVSARVGFHIGAYATGASRIGERWSDHLNRFRRSSSFPLPFSQSHLSSTRLG